MKNWDDLQRLVSEDEASIIYECGFGFRPTLENVPDIVRSICIHSCIVPIKAELDHLCEGLSLFKIYDLIKQFPDQLKDLFVVRKSSNITTTTFISLFDIDFSYKAREAEEAAVFYWYEFLTDVQNGLVSKYSME